MAAITRYDSRRGLNPLQQEIERAFRSAFGDIEGVSPAGAFSPLLDVEEDEEAFTLHVELPGVDPEDVEVSLEENVLTVSGERRFYGEKEAEGFRRIERHFGRFHRAVRLPDRVDPERVGAVYRDGLLRISVPKAEDAKPRRIQVTSG